jgi:diguanylate cyclase (GGDEF)-like protein
MSLRRRILVNFMAIVIILSLFAAYQFWAYGVLFRNNAGITMVSDIVGYAKTVQQSQINYASLYSRHYLSDIEETIGVMIGRTHELKSGKFLPQSDFILTEIITLYALYGEGLQQFTTSNDQYHAIHVDLNLAKTNLLNLIYAQENSNMPLRDTILLNVLEFVDFYDKDSEVAKKALTQLIDLALYLGEEATMFENQLFAKRLEITARKNIELLDKELLAYRINQGNLYALEKTLREISEKFSEIQASAQHYSRVTLQQVQLVYYGIFIVILVVVVMVLYRLSKRINHAIKLLVQGAESISKGDYHNDIQLQGNDEFALLANHLNDMGHELRMSNLSVKTYSNQLEHMVKAKTFELTKTKEALEELNERLKTEKEKLSILALTDALTGLNNRPAFLDVLRRKMDEFSRYQKTFSVMLIDIDHFKKVNDTWGHMIGDEVLKLLASILMREVRASDFVARYGGEEFIILFAELSLSHAFDIAERIRMSVSKEVFSSANVQITISGGLVTYSGESADDLLVKVDQLLYVAKEKGRNCVETGRS